MLWRKVFGHEQMYLLRKIFMKLKIFFYFYLISNLLNAQSVSAATLKDSAANLGKVAGKAGVAQNVDIGVTVGRIIRGGLSAVGLIFFILIFYGGFTWMLARGDENKIKSSRNTVIAATIGLIIVLAAYALTALLGRVVG